MGKRKHYKQIMRQRSRKNFKRDKIIAIVIGVLIGSIVAGIISQIIIPIMLVGSFILLIACYLVFKESYIHQNLFDDDLRRMCIITALFISFEASAGFRLWISSLIERGIL